MLRALSHQPAPATFTHTAYRLPAACSSSSSIPPQLTYLPSYLHGATDHTAYTRRVQPSKANPALAPAHVRQPVPYAHAALASARAPPTPHAPAASASSLLPLLLDDAAWHALQEVEAPHHIRPAPARLSV